MRLKVGMALALLACLGGCGRTVPTAAISPKPSNRAPAPVSPTSSAVADPCGRMPGGTSALLPVADFGRVVADPQNCQVFISSPAGNVVIVADYSGNVIKTIPDEYGAGAMVVEGSNLYVTLTTTGSIDQIDTRSLTRVRTVASGLVKPRDLAFAGGRLWTTTGVCAQWTMKLVSVDPVSGTVAQFDADRSTNLSYCAGFATGSAGKLLVAWDSGLSPGSITVLDVSSGRPVILVSKREENLGNLVDAAVGPGGDKLVTASGAPYEFDQWNLSTATQDGVVYPASPYPNSVAISPVRRGLVATGVSQSNGDSVAEWELGKPAPVATMLKVGINHNLLYPRGLAFSRDGGLIFAVTGVALDGSAPTVTLNVLPGPSLP